MKYFKFLSLSVLFLSLQGALLWAPQAAAAKDRGDSQTLPADNNLPSVQKNLRNGANDREIYFGEDKRLLHPWLKAKEVPAKEVKTVPWFGEKLKFKISWAFITAGEAEMNFDKIVDINGQKAYKAETIAKSYSAIDAVFKVRDNNVSWLSADSLRSLGYWQSVREGKYARDEWVEFNYAKNDFKTYKQDKNGQITTWENNFRGASIYDMLSSLYYVRTRRLPLKTTVFFDIVNRNRQYPLKVEVLRRETVKVKAGEFKCIVVEPMISGEGIFVSKGKSLKVWLTDDEYKMPVKMTVEVFIGNVSAELAEYSREK